MSTYDAGDWRVPTLTVDPADDTTMAALEIEAPDGTTTTLTPVPGDSRATWSAPAYQLTAGRWIERWIVAGTGAGTERCIVQVAADPAAPIPGAYATVVDLTGWIGSTPSNAAMLLIRASRDVDHALLCAVYDTTNVDVVEALRTATLEQVAAGLDGGDKTGNGAVRSGGFQLGKLAVQAPAVTPAEGGPSKVGRLWTQAWLVLQQAGLTGHGPQTW
ncbi:hypothetical protein [Micromonospora sp. NPDC004704]